MIDVIVVFIVLGVVMIGPLLLELLERRMRVGGKGRMR